MKSGKIIAILSKNEFIIDIGGLLETTRLAIKDSNELALKDGETEIGTFSRTKGYIEVVESYPNFSYCKTEIIETKSKSRPFFTPVVDLIQDIQATTKTRPPLQVDTLQITELQYNPVISIGDKVVTIE